MSYSRNFNLESFVQHAVKSFGMWYVTQLLLSRQLNLKSLISRLESFCEGSARLTQYVELVCWQADSLFPWQLLPIFLHISVTYEFSAQ